MSEDVGPGRPPAANRFRKGVSGNPKGRPRSQRERSTSAFDIVIDRTLTVTHNGEPREVTVEEALQHRTYQDAIAGNRAAGREVLKMIVKREAWLASKLPKHSPLKMLIEPVDPANANEALLLLEIAEPDAPGPPNPDERHERVVLRPWAVQAALSRPGRRSLSDQDIAETKRCTRNAQTLRWPAGTKK